MGIEISSIFNSLPIREKWRLWKKQVGTWACEYCTSILTDGPGRARPFHGCSIHCGVCDRELTRRTGGGMNDPFRWVLMPSTTVTP